MNKKKIIVFIILFVVVLALGMGGYFLLVHKEQNKDALRFKEEYEALNDTIRDSDGAKYNNVNIDKNNPIKYVTVEEAIELLDSKKAIIYVGANWCPWCRNMISPMLDVAKKLNIKTIYYLELDDDKSNYEIQNNELKQINKGSQSYYKLLDKLKDYLSDYELTDSDGKTYATGEKRIYMPFFITIKNGGIVEAKEISRTLEDGQTKYAEMTEKQYNDLYDNFYETFGKIYKSDSTCSPDQKCN